MPLEPTASKTIKNLINGQLLDPIDGLYIDNYEPATGQVYALTPDSNEQDLQTVRSASAR